MENLTYKLMNYQETVQQLLMGYAENKPAYGDIEVEIIFDTQRNHYQIMHLGWQHKRWIHHCVMHLDIRNEKIWIFYNSTEHDIAADLVRLGVPKQDIVLGFHPPFMREMSDYGVG
ncbi:MAG: XisI protein [Nostoc sp. CreGUA01]|nr:XisI protein [Nostoc sp. CreGUA01]